MKIQLQIKLPSGRASILKNISSGTTLFWQSLGRHSLDSLHHREPFKVIHKEAIQIVLSQKCNIITGPHLMTEVSETLSQFSHQHSNALPALECWLSGTWPLGNTSICNSCSPCLGRGGSHPDCVLLLIHYANKLLASSLSYLMKN